MTPHKTPNTFDPKLRDIVNRLVRMYQPERVYLFGSHARDDAGPDSDYDLLLVVSDSSPPERRNGKLGYQALWGVDAVVDIVVWTSSAFYRRARVPASLPATVLREGKLLHAT